MRGIVVPEQEEDFTADPVELFFDLAFVFAFSRLVLYLVEHHSWRGVAEAGLLFLMIWYAWSQFTWSANAISGNGRVVRALFLVATIASVPIGASIAGAYGPAGPWFAVSVSMILLMGIGTMLLGLGPSSSAFAAAVRYTIPNLFAVAVIVGGSFLAGSPRIIAWLIGYAIIIGGTLAAGSEEWIIRPGHFAERHGLIVIVALGEVIVAVGAPVVETLSGQGDLPTTTAVSLAAAAIFACLLWWAYFDRLAVGLEHRASQLSGTAAGRYARDVYTYAHIPIVAGIILAAAAIEEISLHPNEPVPLVFRVMLAAGVGMNLLGVFLGVFRAYRSLAIERLVAVATGIVLIALLADVAGYILLIIVDVGLLTMLVVEHMRVERQRRFVPRQVVSR